MNEFFISQEAPTVGSAIDDLVETIGNLWTIAIPGGKGFGKIVDAILTNGFVQTAIFKSEYDFDLPASVTDIISYQKTMIDSMRTQKLTSFQKPKLVEGDLVVAMSAVSLEQELNNYITLPWLVQGANFDIWIGYAAGTETDFYTPFTGAASARYFGRFATEQVRKNVVAAAGQKSHATAPIN